MIIAMTKIEKNVTHGHPDRRGDQLRRPGGNRPADVPGAGHPAGAGRSPAYPPLELAGRDIYVREGCCGCHSQQVRTLESEVQRYGHYSVAGESVYDRPFQWGSKRTGPDLARVGGRYSDDWHRVHLTNPRDVVPESNMPGYPWLNNAPSIRPTWRIPCARCAGSAILLPTPTSPAPAPPVTGKTGWRRSSPTSGASARA